LPIVSLKVIPIAGTPSVSHLVAEAVKAIRDHGYEPMVTPDTTVFEAESLEGVGRLLEDIRSRMREMGAHRLVMILMVDSRFDRREKTLVEMVRSVEEKLSQTSQVGQPPA